MAITKEDYEELKYHGYEGRLCHCGTTLIIHCVLREHYACAILFSRRAEFKEKIDLDISVQRYDTKKIEARLMVRRITGIFFYHIDNHQRGVYDRRLGAIA